MDFVLNFIAGDYKRNYEVAAINGTILQVGVMKRLTEEVNFFPLLAKRLTHLGATPGSQGRSDSNLAGQIIASHCAKPFKTLAV